MAVSPFAKQLFVAISPLMAGLAVGGAISFPTVLLHQLKAKDSNIHLDFNTASWIGAIHGIAGLPSIFMPTIMQWQGRKIALIAACLISITGWILAYSTNTSILIIISESFHGLGNNSIYVVTCLSISEMIAPKYRDNFLKLYFALNILGMAMTGLLMQYFHWRTICIIMCIPMILALFIACMWPESPYWLALQGKLEKCEEAFVWLRGTDADSKRELNALMNAQKERIKDFGTRPIRTKSFIVYVNKIWDQISSRDLYIPCIHTFVLEYLVQGTGCLIIMIYSIELFQKITTNETIVSLSSFIVNMIVLLGYVAIICFNKYIKQKLVFLLSIFGAVVSLISTAVVTYLQSIRVLSEDTLACTFCLIAFIISMSLGLLPLAAPIASALVPVRHRGIGGSVFVACICLLHTLALKLAPYMFVYLNLWGTFLLFAVNGILCGLIIWRFVPDTQGRTLLDIENFYKYGKFIDFKTNTDESLEPMTVNLNNKE